MKIKTILIFLLILILNSCSLSDNQAINKTKNQNIKALNSYFEDIFSNSQKITTSIKTSWDTNSFIQANIWLYSVNNITKANCNINWDFDYNNPFIKENWKLNTNFYLINDNKKNISYSQIINFSQMNLEKSSYNIQTDKIKFLIWKWFYFDSYNNFDKNLIKEISKNIYKYEIFTSKNKTINNNEILYNIELNKQNIKSIIENISKKNKKDYSNTITNLDKIQFNWTIWINKQNTKYFTLNWNIIFEWVNIPVKIINTSTNFELIFEENELILEKKDNNLIWNIKVFNQININTIISKNDFLNIKLSTKYLTDNIDIDLDIKKTNDTLKNIKIRQKSTYINITYLNK